MGRILHLSDEEYECVKETEPTICKFARQLLEYGEAKEGYWTTEKFMKQLRGREDCSSQISQRGWLETSLDFQPQQLSCSHA